MSVYSDPRFSVNHYDEDGEVIDEEYYEVRGVKNGCQRIFRVNV